MPSIDTDAPVTHAHVERTARDCDGLYESTLTAVGSRADLLELYLPDPHEDEDGRRPRVEVLFRPGGFSWSEPTDEGYLAYDVTLCSSACDLDAAGTFRDHTAERAGY